MLAELLAKFREYAIEGMRAKLHPLDSEPAHVYGVETPDGVLEKRYAEPDPRGHTAHSLQALIDLVNDDRKGIAFAGDEFNPATLFYGPAGVTLVFDLRTRRDKAHYALIPSSPFKLLLDWAMTRKMFPQRDFLRHCRLELTPAAFASAGNLLTILREIKFENSAAGTSVVQHGKESMGKSITASVLGTDALPEAPITLFIPVYANADLSQTRYPVPCHLHVEPSTATFGLFALPGALESAVDMAMDNIQKTLDAGTDIPIIHADLN